jgi:hypothetical protein
MLTIVVNVISDSNITVSWRVIFIPVCTVQYSSVITVTDHWTGMRFLLLVKDFNGPLLRSRTLFGDSRPGSRKANDAAPALTPFYWFVIQVTEPEPHYFARAVTRCGPGYGSDGSGSKADVQNTADRL